jgi:hypothetical protein
MKRYLRLFCALIPLMNFIFLPGYCIAGEISETIILPGGVHAPGTEYMEPFEVQFTFDPPPRLNKIGTVYLRIKALGYFSIEPRISVIRSDLSVECDKMVEPRWIPPIETGDIYEGSYQLKPTKSGDYITGISILVPELPYPPNNLYRIYLGFTESGELAYLSDLPQSGGEDTLGMLKSQSRGISLDYEGEYFFCRFVVGIPEVGETTNVYFYVNAEDESAEVMNIDIVSSEGLNVVERYEGSFGTVNEVMIYKGNCRILPRKVGRHNLVLNVNGNSSSSKNETRSDAFEVVFVFDETGKIKQITKGSNIQKE